MKKRFFIACIILSLSSMVFAAEADKYIADLDPAKDETTIIKAADWLGEKQEKDAAGKLVNLLSDSRDMVRLHVVMALGYIGKEDYVDALNNVFLGDKNASVRYAALLSTMKIRSDKSIPVWKKAKETETDPYIKDLLTKLEEKAKGK